MVNLSPEPVVIISQADWNLIHRVLQQAVAMRDGSRDKKYFGAFGGNYASSQSLIWDLRHLCIAVDKMEGLEAESCELGTCRHQECARERVAAKRAAARTSVAEELGSAPVEG